MADVLSQNEVDALLSAVHEGDLEVTTEIQDTSSEVSTYDFKRPERVSKDQIRALLTLHEAFARNYGATLSGILRTIVEVKMASVEQLTYSEFIMSLPNPTSFNLLIAPPLDGKIVLELNPSIVFPLIDKHLGGGNLETIIPDREMTIIEQRLVNQFLDSALIHLKETWAPIKEIDFQVTDNESNPQLMQIVPPNMSVVLICFEIRMGDASGMMNICVPFPVIEPIMNEFSTIQTWFSAGTRIQDETIRNNIQDGLRDAKLNGIVYLAETRFTIRELLHLQVGDIIETHKLVKEPLLMTVANKPKYLGKIGTIRDRKGYLIQAHADLHQKI